VQNEKNKDLKAFSVYLDEIVQTNSNISPEECLTEWRATIAAIQAGLDDVAAGRTTPLDQFDREFRDRHNHKLNASVFPWTHRLSPAGARR